MKRRSFLKILGISVAAPYIPASANKPAINESLSASVTSYFDNAKKLRHACLVPHVRGMEEFEKEIAVRELKDWLKRKNIKPGTRYILIGPEYEDFESYIAWGIEVGPDIDNKKGRLSHYEYGVFRG